MKKSSYLYTRCYCEENVYKFLERIHEEQLREEESSSSFASTLDGAYAVWLSSLGPNTQFASNNKKSDENEDTDDLPWKGSLVPIFLFDLMSETNVLQLRKTLPPLPDLYVVWDYHVVGLLHTTSGEWFVADFDTRLNDGVNDDDNFLIPAEHYFKKSLFPVQYLTAADFLVSCAVREKKKENGDVNLCNFFAHLGRFCTRACSFSVISQLEEFGEKVHMRIVPAETFLREFRSDRSHMWDAKNDTYMSPPPPYPPINCSGEEKETNVLSFIDMRGGSSLGEVVPRDKIIAWLQQHK